MTSPVVGTPVAGRRRCSSPLVLLPVPSPSPGVTAAERGGPEKRPIA
jgi:hypothetical protein